MRRARIYHVFAKQAGLVGARWWHETGHRDLDDAKSDARELRDGYQHATTKILRGEDSFAWVTAKVADLNRPYLLAASAQKEGSQ